MNNQENDLTLLLDAIETCDHCGGELIAVPYKKLPKEVKEQSKNMPPGLLGHFYCPECEIYSAVGAGCSSLDDMENGNPIKRVAPPSLNGPCPCNSGKKYKRCCGKN